MSTIYQWIGPFGDIKSMAVCAAYKKDLPKKQYHQTERRIFMGMESLWFRIGHRGGFVLKDGTESGPIIFAFSTQAGHVAGPQDLTADDRTNRTSGDWREIVKSRIQTRLDLCR